MIPGSFQTRANVHNDYLVDREKQKNVNYTGISTFPLQDIAMMENQWGPIADRTREHLTSLDYQIIQIRQRLLAAARALANGIEPAEPWRPEAYRYRRASAVGATADEAIERAKALAFESRIASEVEALAPEIRV
jgi:hypothetical protein